MITKFKLFENREFFVKLNANAIYFGVFLFNFFREYFNDDNISYRIDTRRIRKVDGDIIIEEYLQICLDRYSNNKITIDYLPGNRVRYLSPPNMFDKKYVKLNDDLIELASRYTSDILKNHFVIDIDKINELKNDILLYKEMNKYNL